MSGKGDRDRTKNKPKFNDNYDRIFGDKKKAKPVKDRQKLSTFAPQ